MKSNNQVIAIIQARVTSERLPGKVLLPLAGKSIIEHVLERAHAMEGISRVILATGNLRENRDLEAIASKHGVEFFAGSDENVLERFVSAAEPFNPEFIVRITADNPLVDVEYGSLAVSRALERKPDLSSLVNIPLGTALEVIQYDALKRSLAEGTEPYHFEHVTPYIKEHEDFFTIERYPVEMYNPFENLRLTVDTREDYTLMKSIFRALYRGKPITLDRVIAYLEENSHLLKLNNRIIQRPMTHSASPAHAAS